MTRGDYSTRIAVCERARNALRLQPMGSAPRGALSDEVRFALRLEDERSALVGNELVPPPNQAGNPPLPARRRYH